MSIAPIPLLNAELLTDMCTLAIVLKDELETTMRMCGVNNLSQVHPGLVNTAMVDHLVPDSVEHPYVKWRPKSMI